MFSFFSTFCSSRSIHYYIRRTVSILVNHGELRFTVMFLSTLPYLPICLTCKHIIGGGGGGGNRCGGDGITPLGGWRRGRKPWERVCKS
jgi:hypothetical protein